MQLGSRKLCRDVGCFFTRRAFYQETLNPKSQRERTLARRSWRAALRSSLQWGVQKEECGAVGALGLGAWGLGLGAWGMVGRSCPSLVYPVAEMPKGWILTRDQPPPPPPPPPPPSCQNKTSQTLGSGQKDYASTIEERPGLRSVWYL